MDASSLIGDTPVVPVVVIEDPAKAGPLARCLAEAGLRIIEVTLRTEASIEAIGQIAEQVPSLLVGAGSIREVSQLDASIRAGARFAVSPGATEQLLDAVELARVAFVPGAATPTEVMRLLHRGYRLQKFFPAELAGGTAMLKAISGPLPEVFFVPTGGITAETANDYLSLANVRAIGGSWIAPPDLLGRGDFERIGRLAAQAAALGKQTGRASP